MEENIDNKFMRRCLDLAMKAEGMTYPNPLVGSVIVHEGKIIGEGFHLKSGLPHAEVNAINSVKDASLLKRSTLYVNLEPCSHFGKTPPCADLIVEKGIPKVVIGTSDTTVKVSGKGIAMLRESGCEVINGVLEKESRWINRRFFTFNEKKRPYIILKWAQSADGFIDIKRTDDLGQGPNWISGKPERVLVHKWRATEQSILIGGSTARIDTPRLNVREWKGRDPLILILSSSGELPEKYKSADSADRIIVFTHSSAEIPGINMVRLDHDEPSGVQVTRYLYNIGIGSLFIEGGAKVLNHFITNGLWDEARVFSADIYFREGVRAPEMEGKLLSETEFSGSLLQTFLNK